MTTPIPTQIISSLITRLGTIKTSNGYLTTVGTIKSGMAAEEPLPDDTFPVISIFSNSDEPVAGFFAYKRTLQLECIAKTTTSLDDLLSDLRNCLLQYPGQRWLSDDLSVEDPEIGSATFQPYPSGSEYFLMILIVSFNYSYHPE